MQILTIGRYSLFTLAVFPLRMKKIYILILAAFLPFYAESQSDTYVKDSLKNIWEDPTNSESERMKAAKSFFFKYARSSPDETINALGAYIQLAKEMNETREEAGALVELGSVYRDLGKYEDAVINYNAALLLANEMEDASLSGVIEGNIGNVYNDQEDLLSAFQQYRKALNIFTVHGDTLFTSYIHASIGNVNLQIENYELAESSYLKASEILTNSGQEPSPIIQMNLAIIAYEQNDFTKAKELFEKALDKVKIQHDFKLEIGCYQHLAKIDRALDLEEKDSFYAQEALRVAIDYGNPFLIEEAKIEVILSQKDIGWHLTMHKRLLNREEYISNQTKEEVYNEIKNIYKQQGEFEKALNAFDQEIKYKSLNDSIRSSKRLIAESINLEEELLLEKERSKEQIEAIQSNIRIVVSFIFVIVVLALLVFFFVKNSRSERHKLLEQIDLLKRNQSPIVMAIENKSNLNRGLLERHINQKLNDTDWKVLSELEQNPVVSNKTIAENIFMSVEGISSSLRRMYVYFNIGETRYKKIALVMKAIQISK